MILISSAEYAEKTVEAQGKFAFENGVVLYGSQAKTKNPPTEARGKESK